MGWRTLVGLAEKPGAPTPGSQSHAVEPEQASRDPDWVLAKIHIRERLVSLRRSLEVPGLSHEETEGARYAIVELDGVLNFQKPSKMLAED